MYWYVFWLLTFYSRWWTRWPCFGHSSCCLVPSSSSSGHSSYRHGEVWRSLLQGWHLWQGSCMSSSCSPRLSGRAQPRRHGTGSRRNENGVWKWDSGIYYGQPSKGVQVKFILIYTAPIPDIDMLSNRMLFSSCICMQERIVGFIVPPSFGQRNCSTWTWCWYICPVRHILEAFQ